MACYSRENCRQELFKEESLHLQALTCLSICSFLSWDQQTRTTVLPSTRSMYSKGCQHTLKWKWRSFPDSGVTYSCYPEKIPIEIQSYLTLLQLFKCKLSFWFCKSHIPAQSLTLALHTFLWSPWPKNAMLYLCKIRITCLPSRSTINTNCPWINLTEGCM